MHATINGSHWAMATASTTGTITSRTVSFDTNSGPMGVDNRWSTCMSSRREDFEDNLVVVKYNVKGVGGARVRDVMVGIMNFKCQDNNSMIHHHRLPGSHYAPGLEARLFSPQHFAQSRKDTHPLPIGTKESTYEDCVVLQWDQWKCRMTILLDPRTNVATFQTAPGYKRFQAFCAKAGIPPPPILLTFATKHRPTTSQPRTRTRPRRQRGPSHPRHSI